MQSKKTLVAFSILAVFILTFLGIQTGSQDTPSCDESTVEQAESAIESTPPATNKLALIKAAATKQQAPLQKAPNKIAAMPIQKTQTTDQRWNPYIDKTSQRYEALLEIASNQDSPFMVGDSFYEKVDKGDGRGIIFVNIDQPLIEQTQDALTQYNQHLDDLYNLENYGDWSAETQDRAKEFIARYNKQGNNKVLALQCRQKTCLIQFSFEQLQQGFDFITLLQQNAAACECIIVKTLFPDEGMAIIKMMFRV